MHNIEPTFRPHSGGADAAGAPAPRGAHAMRGVAGAVLAIALLLAPSAAIARGPKLFVAMDGIDTNTCGARKRPCRTISQAVASAPDGATIVVGPGRYGDLDSDGILRDHVSDIGEEEPTVCAAASCALRITKRVSVISSDGPGATVLDGGRDLLYTVALDSGAELGRPKQGFTIVGGEAAGVIVRGNDVRIAGNIVTANEAHGIILDVGIGAVVADNTIAGNGKLGLFAKPEIDDARIERNHIVGNGHAGDGGGIESHGSLLVRGNVITASTGDGIVVAAGVASILGNRVTGNDGSGVVVEATAITSITGNALTGNTKFGVQLLPNAAAVVNENDIYGNDPHGLNCGILNATSMTIEGIRNFWGAASGPGAHPADATCNVLINSIVLVDPVRTKPIKLRIKTAR